jgi:OHCU decarboxylase
MINELDRDSFIDRLGFLFEGSPWIAARTWRARPFKGFEHLHKSLCEAMTRASSDEKIGLIRAHPDLVGRAAREGALTQDSAREQASAGLGRLSAEEIATFERLNQAYKYKFEFPFVICARENRKGTMVERYAVRLSNSRDEEIEIALLEIAKIAYLRMLDVVIRD